MAVNRAYPVTTTVQLTSGGGTGNRFPAGTLATVPRITGHTALNNTSCPGAQMVPLLGQIQAAVQKRIKRFAKRRCRKGAKGKRCRQKRKGARHSRTGKT
jgi:hypothetical protein